MLDILTHENVGALVKSPPGPDQGATTTTLESEAVWHDGQIIAIVVAETYEAAREAARKIDVIYDEQPPSAGFDSPGATTETLEETEQRKNPRIGDAEAALAGAPVRVDAPLLHPYPTSQSDRAVHDHLRLGRPALTIYEPTQSMYGLKAGLARQLGLDPAMVRTVSRFVGGAFGSKGAITSRTAWIAVAARRLGRPVKLVATRDQGFTIATYRAETRHHVRLGATGDGKLVAMTHEGSEVTSRPSKYAVSGVDSTARMYACPNVATRVNIVHADRNTPGFMRAPPDTPYMFALESAMDELAYALELDPIELRRRATTPRPTRSPATIFEPLVDEMLRSGSRAFRMEPPRSSARVHA